MLKVILTGGGSGGHVNPALAIADIIKSKAQSGTVTFNDISPNSLGTFKDYEFPLDR